MHDYRDEDDRDDPPAPRWGVDITDVGRRPIAQSNTERTRRWVESAAAAAVAAGQQEYLTLTYDATTPRDRSSSAVLTLLCPRCPRRRGSITGRDILLALPRLPSVVLVVVPISEPSFEPARTLRLAVVCGDAASLLLFKTRPTPGDRYEGSLAQRQSAYDRNSIDIVDGEDLDSDVGGDLCDFQ